MGGSSGFKECLRMNCESASGAHLGSCQPTSAMRIAPGYIKILQWLTIYVFR